MAIFIENSSREQLIVQPSIVIFFTMPLLHLPGSCGTTIDQSNVNFTFQPTHVKPTFDWLIAIQFEINLHRYIALQHKTTLNTYKEGLKTQHG